MRDPNKDKFQALLIQMGECVAESEQSGALPSGSLYRLRSNTRTTLNAILQDWQDIQDPPPPTLKSWILGNHISKTLADGSKICEACNLLFPCETRAKAEELGQ